MKKYTSVEDYINDFSPEVQVKLRSIRTAIRGEVPHETTEKISYQIPTFYLYENLVHFAAFKDHISFFPTGSGVEKFRKELHNYKISKGTIQVPLHMNLPIPLIKKITRFRVQEVVTKQRLKICSRGHIYKGSAPCPMCWPGRITKSI